MFADTLTSKALRTLGVIQPGQALEAIDSATGLECANDMLDAWAAQRLTIFHIAPSTIPVVPGQGSPSTPYTIGFGGSFNQAWPEYIDHATLLLLSSTPPIEIPLYLYDDAEWDDVGIKTLPSALASGLYYDHAFAPNGPSAGLGNILLYPVPNGQQPLSLTIYVPMPLFQFADANATPYTFPPGYAEALRYQLALRLGPEYGQAITPDVASLASSTFGVIQKPNARMPVLIPDLPSFGGSGGGLYNWRTGTNQ